MTDQDEESVLSDSYSDCHSSTVPQWTAVPCGANTLRTVQIKNRNPEHPLTVRDKDGHKSGNKDRMTKIATGNVRNPKGVTVDMDQIGLVDALLGTKTTMVPTRHGGNGKRREITWA